MSSNTYFKPIKKSIKQSRNNLKTQVAGNTYIEGVENNNQFIYKMPQPRVNLNNPTEYTNTQNSRNGTVKRNDQLSLSNQTLTAMDFESRKHSTKAQKIIHAIDIRGHTHSYLRQEDQKTVTKQNSKMEASDEEKQNLETMNRTPLGAQNLKTDGSESNILLTPHLKQDQSQIMIRQPHNQEESENLIRSSLLSVSKPNIQHDLRHKRLTQHTRARDLDLDQLNHDLDNQNSSGLGQNYSPDSSSGSESGYGRYIIQLHQPKTILNVQQSPIINVQQQDSIISKRKVGRQPSFQKDFIPNIKQKQNKNQKKVRMLWCQNSFNSSNSVQEIDNGSKSYVVKQRERQPIDMTINSSRLLESQASMIKMTQQSPMTNSLDGKSMMFLMKPSYDSNNYKMDAKLNQESVHDQSNTNQLKGSPQKIVDIPSPVLKNKLYDRSKTKLPNSIAKLLRARNKQLFGSQRDDKNNNSIIQPVLQTKNSKNMEKIKIQEINQDFIVTNSMPGGNKVSQNLLNLSTDSLQSQSFNKSLSVFMPQPQNNMPTPNGPEDHEEKLLNDIEIENFNPTVDQNMQMQPLFNIYMLKSSKNMYEKHIEAIGKGNNYQTIAIQNSMPDLNGKNLMKTPVHMPGILTNVISTASIHKRSQTKKEKERSQGNTTINRSPDVSFQRSPLENAFSGLKQDEGNLLSKKATAKTLQACLSEDPGIPAMMNQKTPINGVNQNEKEYLQHIENLTNDICPSSRQGYSLPPIDMSYLQQMQSQHINSYRQEFETSLRKHKKSVQKKQTLKLRKKSKPIGSVLIATKDLLNMSFHKNQNSVYKQDESNTQRFQEFSSINNSQSGINASLSPIRNDQAVRKIDLQDSQFNLNLNIQEHSSMPYSKRNSSHLPAIVSPKDSQGAMTTIYSEKKSQDVKKIHVTFDQQNSQKGSSRQNNMESLQRKSSGVKSNPFSERGPNLKVTVAATQAGKSRDWQGEADFMDAIFNVEKQKQQQIEEELRSVPQDLETPTLKVSKAQRKVFFDDLRKGKALLKMTKEALERKGPTLLDMSADNHTLYQQSPLKTERSFQLRDPSKETTSSYMDNKESAFANVQNSNNSRGTKQEHIQVGPKDSMLLINLNQIEEPLTAAARPKYTNSDMELLLDHQEQIKLNQSAQKRGLEPKMRITMNSQNFQSNIKTQNYDNYDQKSPVSPKQRHCIKIFNKMSQLLDGQSPTMPKASLQLKMVGVDVTEEEYSRNSQYDFNEGSSFHITSNHRENTIKADRESIISDLRSPVSAINGAAPLETQAGVNKSPVINKVAKKYSFQQKIQIVDQQSPKRDSIHVQTSSRNLDQTKATSVNPIGKQLEIVMKTREKLQNSFQDSVGVPNSRKFHTLTKRMFSLDGQASSHFNLNHICQMKTSRKKQLEKLEPAELKPKEKRGVPPSNPNSKNDKQLQLGPSPSKNMKLVKKNQVVLGIDDSELNQLGKRNPFLTNIQKQLNNSMACQTSPPESSYLGTPKITDSDAQRSREYGYHKAQKQGSISGQSYGMLEKKLMIQMNQQSRRYEAEIRNIVSEIKEEQSSNNISNMNSNTKLHNKSSYPELEHKHVGVGQSIAISKFDNVNTQAQQHLSSRKALGHQSDFKLGLTLDISSPQSLRHQNNSHQRSNLSMMSPDFGRNGASQVADFEQFVQKNIDNNVSINVDTLVISGQRNFEVGSIQHQTSPKLQEAVQSPEPIYKIE